MDHEINLYSCGCRQCLLAISTRLFALRDALHEMSLALHDWQFEIDDIQRQSIENKTSQLLKKIAAGQGPVLH